jgi:hypothetical protein
MKNKVEGQAGADHGCLSGYEKEPRRVIRVRLLRMPSRADWVWAGRLGRAEWGQERRILWKHL